MSAEAPHGHGELLSGLWSAAVRGRLAHALLLEGPAGIGKHLAAVHLARGLLCAAGPGAPCDTCGPCARSGSGEAPPAGRTNHPDLLAIDPDADGEERIGIGYVVKRDPGPKEPLDEFLRYRASEGGWRVAILRDAHRMTVEAQNALLKRLEEPADGTLLVLVTDRPERLLMTIRSRVVRARAFRLPPEEARAVLTGAGVPDELAGVLSRWSGGAPGEALRLQRQGAPAARELLAGVLAGRTDPLAAAQAAWELPGEFPGKTAAGERRARVRAFLDLALEILSDLFAAAQGAQEDGLRHGDLVAPVRGSVAGSAGPARRAAQLDALLEVRRDVDRNVTPEALLDQALLLLCPHGDPSPAPARTDRAGAGADARGRR